MFDGVDLMIDIITPVPEDDGLGGMGGGGLDPSMLSG